MTEHYLRSPGKNGICRPCKPDPCMPYNYLYTPCAGQCALPLESDPPYILPEETPDFVIIKVRGVKLVFERGESTMDAITDTTVEPGEPPTACPTATNKCFLACCVGGKPAAIIISQAQFDTLFPGNPGNACLVWEDCYYCAPINATNPVSDEAAEVAASETYDVCAEWPQEERVDCTHCVPCNDCEPNLPWTFTITISGCNWSFGNLNGTHVLYYEPYDGQLCNWHMADDDLDISITLVWEVNHWQVYLSVSYAGIYVAWFTLIFRLLSDPCSPEGIYTYYTCGCDPYDGCIPGSCEASMGAVVVIS